MRIKIALFLLCFVTALALPLVAPQPVMATTAQVYSSKDTYLNKEYTTTNYGTGSAIYAGVPIGTYTRRSVVEFPVTWGTTVPTGATITSATLYMRYNGKGGSDPVGRTIRAQRMVRTDWSETTSTWANYKTGSNWTTEGCGSSSTDYTTTGQASATVPAAYGWMTWTITTQVQYAQTNNRNVIVRIVDSSEAADYLTAFSSREGSYDPYILINYISPPTVVTGAATSVLNTTATLGGTISSIGDSTVTTRGFQYGLTETPTWNVNETGSFSTGAYSLNVSGISPGTTYHFRAFAVNAAGTGYGSWVTFATYDYPDISTVDASNVASTSARLNAALEYDGGDDCTIKFGWGLSNKTHVEDYDSYETLPGTYSTGTYPYLAVAGLVAGYTYYFRVSATNLIGTVEGDELTFNTTVSLSAPTNLIGYPEATTISLSWAKGTGSTNTLARYGTTDYPATNTSGTEAYFGPGSTYTITGLTSGKTYYISLWGESGGNFSSTYTTLLMTTSASGAGTIPDIDVPDQPSRWLSAPDYTTMDGLIIIYDAFNTIADTGEVPRETAWFLLALGLSFVAGLLAYLGLGRKLLIGMIVLTMALAFGYFVKLIPWWIPLMTLILVIVWSQTHKQTSEG
jgi:hypothetical protein